MHRGVSAEETCVGIYILERLLFRMEKDCGRPAGDRGGRREMAAGPQGGQGGNKRGGWTGDVLDKERPHVHWTFGGGKEIMTQG